MRHFVQRSQVGLGREPRPVQELVIINASDEDRALYGLDKETGKQVWRSEATNLSLAFGTPVIVEAAGPPEMVLAVPGEIWGMNPETGKTLWHCAAPMTGNVSPSVVVEGGVVYAFGGFLSRGSAAVKLGAATTCPSRTAVEKQTDELRAVAGRVW